MKKNTLTIVWISLVILTVIEYLFTEISISTKLAFIGIMIASFLKYLGVAFQFLELKHAHSFWKSFAVIIVLVFFTVITVLYI